MSTDHDWDVLGYVEASHYRTDVLTRLGEGPATPTMIAEDIEYEVTHVSRCLRELKQRDLVELLVDESVRKGRFYGITADGDDALAGLEQIGEVDA
jgi:DNA-binding MarR family transcriptional regulator